MTFFTPKNASQTGSSIKLDKINQFGSCFTEHLLQFEIL